MITHSFHLPYGINIKAYRSEFKKAHEGVDLIVYRHYDHETSASLVFIGIYDMLESVMLGFVMRVIDQFSDKMEEIIPYCVLEDMLKQWDIEYHLTDGEWEERVYILP